MLKLKIFAPQTPFSIHFSHGMETSVVKKCSLLKLSYVWIFTSRIFRNKKKLSGRSSLSSSELEIRITTIPIGPFVIILLQIKELVKRILEMILRFCTYVIPSFKIDGIRSSQSPNQLHVCPWSSMQRARWPPKSSEFVGNPREDSHVKVKGLLVGKLI